MSSNEHRAKPAQQNLSRLRNSAFRLKPVLSRKRTVQHRQYRWDLVVLVHSFPQHHIPESLVIEVTAIHDGKGYPLHHHIAHTCVAQIRRIQTRVYWLGLGHNPDRFSIHLTPVYISVVIAGVVLILFVLLFKDRNAAQQGDMPLDPEAEKAAAMGSLK